MTARITAPAARDADLTRPSPAWLFVPMLPILVLIVLIIVAVGSSS